MRNLIQDLRYSFRRLSKNPGFTLIAVLSLALGIGANTSIFSLVNTVLLRPLPVAHPEQLVAVYGVSQNGVIDTNHTFTSYPNYKDYRDHSTDVFDGLLAYRFAPISFSRGGNNERMWVYIASGNYFDVLGVKPVLGRGFLPEEDRTPGAAPVAVISYGCWQQRFASDASIIGRTVLLNNHSFTIIGVAPQGFIGTEVAFAPELWVPAAMQNEIEPGNDWLDDRNQQNNFVIGRLKPNTSAAQAEAALGRITRQLAGEYPAANEGLSVRVLPPGLFIPDARRTIITFSGVLMAVVGLVLLIACVNLANLLLARATERRKEIAIRIALGASRARLVRQLLTESVLLSIIGGACGVLLAMWTNDFITAIKLPTDTNLIFDMQLDWRVLAFAVVLSLLTGIVFGLVPALQSSKPDLVPALKDAHALAGFRRSYMRNSLVVAQVALSLLLLIGAGLIIRSLQRAQSMRPGFNPENAVALSFDLGLQGYDQTKGREFHKQVINRVSALPGVQSVALTNYLPLSLYYDFTNIYVEGQPQTSASNMPSVIPSSIGLNYFQTMGISLLRGRDFTAEDDKPESRVAIVNETFARRFYLGQDPIGKRFNFDGPGEPFWQIIGIAADGKYNSLGENPKPFVYRPLLRNYASTITLVARTKADSQATLALMRSEVQSLDPTLPLYDVKTLTEHMKIPLFPARMAAIALGSFGVLALVLAAIGIYGVMSYSVAGRTREIGIRLSLGAEPRDVLQLIIRQGMLLALLGLGAGLTAALLLTRLLESLLYGVSATDALTFACVPLLLASIALLACYVPARRATKVDPMIALRYE